MTRIAITGASGHAVDIDAEGSDLQTVTRVANKLWKDTMEATPVQRIGFGLITERRANLPYRPTSVLSETTMEE